MKTSNSKPRLLVVDDEEYLGKALRRALKHDFEVTSVTTPEDAVAFSEDDIDVVLLDWDLGIHGEVDNLHHCRFTNLLEELRVRGLPVVVHTGKLVSPITDVPVVYKPATRIELVDTILTAMEKHQDERADV